MPTRAHIEIVLSNASIDRRRWSSSSYIYKCLLYKSRTPWLICNWYCAHEMVYTVCPVVICIIYIVIVVAIISNIMCGIPIGWQVSCLPREDWGPHRLHKGIIYNSPRDQYYHCSKYEQVGLLSSSSIGIALALCVIDIWWISLNEWIIYAHTSELRVALIRKMCVYNSFSLSLSHCAVCTDTYLVSHS